MDAGVLADVEGLEVEAVGADLHEERVDEHSERRWPLFWRRLLRRTVRSLRRSAALV